MQATIDRLLKEIPNSLLSLGLKKNTMSPPVPLMRPTISEIEGQRRQNKEGEQKDDERRLVSGDVRTRISRGIKGKSEY